MQLQDIQYLTENIWASQSVLSAWKDLNDLVMVRWDKSVEWSPWNCILLTKDEGAIHLKLKSIEEVRKSTCDLSLITGIIRSNLTAFQGFPDSLAGKESNHNVGDLGLILGLGRSPGEQKGYPLQYSGLKNFIDYIVPGVAKRWT